MRKLAIDVGDARIGIAISEGSLVLPLEVLQSSEKSAAEVMNLAKSRSVSAIYVGLPLSLSGGNTLSTKKALDFAKSLGSDIPVRMIDERMSTKSAHSLLRASGRNAKNSKGIVDAQAAALILEFALQSERGGELAGQEPGEFDD